MRRRFGELDSTEKGKNTVRRIFDILLSLIIIDLLCCLFYARYVIYTERVTYIPQAKAAVVLMGDFNDVKTGLGKQTIRRLNYTIDLHRSGYMEYILCVGGARPKLDLYGSEMMRRYLIDNGVPDKVIFKEDRSYDTYTNWIEAEQIIRENNWDSVFVISSPFHIFRARKIITQHAPENLILYFLSFDYSTVEPKATLFELIGRIHYEWASWAIQCLPPDMYNRLIRYLRHQ
jgi:uncharacterized SAM-binding protein YcdF (DUF218 family)